jgi:hypothetical protein
MNTSNHIDHLHVINNINKLAQIQKIVEGSSNSTSFPKVSKTTHYGPGGTDVASISNADYSKLKLSSSGKIIGGTLNHNSSDENGKCIDASALNLSTNGRPSSATTEINNRFTSGIFKKITADFSGINWLDGSLIQSGDIALSTSMNDSPRSTGAISYDNETLTKGSFTHYSSEANGKISGHTDIDYSKVKFLGNAFTGGYVGIVSKTAKKVVKSTSNLFLDKMGRANQIHTSNLDLKSGKVKSEVIADFSKMNFTPRNEFHEGEASYTVKDDGGATMLKTDISFENQVPSLLTINTFDDKEKLKNTILVDYTNVKFNNDLKVVDSTLLTMVHNSKGDLISKTETDYNSNGNPTSKRTDQFEEKTGVQSFSISKDLRNVTFNHQNNPSGGEVQIVNKDLKNDQTSYSAKPIQDLDSIYSTSTESEVTNETESVHKTNVSSFDSSVCSMTKVTNNQGVVTQTKETCKRSNGTTLKTVTIILEDNKPASSIITTFATDGITITKTYKLNLSSISKDASKAISGSIKISSFAGGKTLSSKSELNY